MAAVTADWGGAQWVLATVLIIGVIVPLARRYAPSDTLKESKPGVEFWGEYMGRHLCVVGLIALLNWGGFW